MHCISCSLLYVPGSIYPSQPTGVNGRLIRGRSSLPQRVTFLFCISAVLCHGFGGRGGVEWKETQIEARQQRERANMIFSDQSAEASPIFLPRGCRSVLCAFVGEYTGQRSNAVQTESHKGGETKKGWGTWFFFISVFLFLHFSSSSTSSLSFFLSHSPLFLIPSSHLPTPHPPRDPQFHSPHPFFTSN